MTETPNLNYIKQIAGGDEEFEKRFISIIQIEFPKEKSDYEDSLEKNELNDSATIVHKIKHKLGILGLKGGYELAIKYEENLKQGNTLLQDQFMAVLNTVETYIQKLEIR
ncbi:MAG: Hpt domain-containing protein [Bacteroidota bacterium]